MSALNTFANQLAGRMAARSGVQQSTGSPQSVGAQHAGHAQSADQGHDWNGQNQAEWTNAPAPQQGYATQQNYAQPSFAPAFQPMQDHAPAQPYAQPYAQPQRGGYAPSPDHYAQQRAHSQQLQPQPQYQQPQQSFNQQQVQQQAWQQQPDPRGFDVGSYMTPAQTAAAQAAHQYRQSYPQQADYDQGNGDWNQAQGQDTGFAQPAGGELDPNYGEEPQEFEAEGVPRGRRVLMIAAALAGAIVVGGGLAYGYKSIFGGASGDVPPVIKSAEGPSKAKPADAGGKQFAHTDSKIMGRLGDGNASPASGDVDANGTRKVSTLVVGRDGSIQAPPVAAAQEAAAEPPASPPVPAIDNGTPAVPGLTLVDAFANNRPSSAGAAIAAAVPPAAAKAAEKAVEVAEAAVAAVPQAPLKPVKIAKVQAAKPADVAAASALVPTGSIEQTATAPAAPAPVKKPKKDKVAAATAAPSVTSNSVATTGNGSNGFVAVLASVPRSNSSRIDALKRFADMQQKYGTVLAGKTPDVAEANLGTKGAYHRLVVGPPGSREQASNVCSQLKSQGYGDCWVTSY